MRSRSRLPRLALCLLPVIAITFIRTSPSTAPGTRWTVSSAASVSAGHHGSARQKARGEAVNPCFRSCPPARRMPHSGKDRPGHHGVGRMIRYRRDPSVHYVLLPHPVAGGFGIGAFVAQRSSDITPLAVRRLRQLGAQWVREEFTASALHSGPGRPYDFAQYDRVVNAERRSGLRVLGLLDYSNSWSFGEHNTMPHRSMRRLSEDFGRFASAVVTHFRGRIRFWQVWNEPDLPMFWQPRPDATDYALLLRTTYRFIKAANPAAQVVLAGTSGVDLQFLREIVQHTHSFDILSVHPYRNLPEDRLLSEIHALHSFGRPLWFSEIGWAAGEGCDVCDTEDEQAIYLVRFYTLSLASGVQRIFWYDFRDDTRDAASPEAHFGLLRRDLSGKPAFAAYAILAHLLGSASFLAADRLGQHGVYALRFQSPGGPIVVGWNTGAEPQEIHIPWPAEEASALTLDGIVQEEVGVEWGQAIWTIPPGGVPEYLVSDRVGFSVSPPGPLLHFPPPVRGVRLAPRRIPRLLHRVRTRLRRPHRQRTMPRNAPAVKRKPAARTAPGRRPHPLPSTPHADPVYSIPPRPTSTPVARDIALPSPTPTAIGVTATPTPTTTASPTSESSPTPTPPAPPTATQP